MVRQKMNRYLINICGLLLAIMVLEASWQVVTRYVFNSPSAWTDEILRFQLIWLTMIGAATAHGLNRVMAVTLFTDKLSEKAKNTNRIVVEVLVVLFSVLILIIGGSKVAINAYGQLSASLAINMFYVYVSMPIAGILFVVFGTMNITEAFKTRKEIK